MDLQEAQAARMVIEWKKQGMRQKDMAHPPSLAFLYTRFRGCVRPNVVALTLWVALAKQAATAGMGDT